MYWCIDILIKRIDFVSLVNWFYVDCVVVKVLSNTFILLFLYLAVVFLWIRLLGVWNLAWC